MAGKIAGKTAKRMDTGSGTESRKAVDGDKDRAKDSKHKVRDEEGKTGVGKSGKRFAEDGDALSKQRSGEKRRDGSLPRERKGTDGLSAPTRWKGIKCWISERGFQKRRFIWGTGNQKEHQYLSGAESVRRLPAAGYGVC